MSLKPKTVAIVQSSYIPWKGYFDLIAASDVFVFFDDVQFTKRDWRSRNQIKTSNGALWLTIPVKVKGKFHQKINEVEIAEAGWAKDHWNSIRFAYAKAKFFKDYESLFQEAYAKASNLGGLSQVNELFIRLIVNILNIKTELRNSSEFNLLDEKTERLASICEQLQATNYLSGPAAAAYIEEKSFTDRQIGLSYFDYSGYREYEQLYPPFRHDVSILDLIFNAGPESPLYLKFSQNKSCQTH